MENDSSSRVNRPDGKNTGDHMTEKAIPGWGKKTNKPSAFIQIDLLN